MAAIVRYVNVNSLAGGDGTTNATTGVNRAYSSQSEMEAAEQSDLVSSGDTFTGICSGGLDSSNVTYSGWLTSATNDILITTTTDRHAGVFDNTKYYIDTGTGTAAALSVGVNYINFAGLQFQRDGTITSGTIRYCINVSGVGVGKVTVTESIFKNISAHPGGSVAINIADSSPIYGIKNNIFYNFNVSGQAVAMTASTPEAYVYNNTFIDCIEGISSRATAKIRNNIFQDCASDIVGSQSTENDYNLTDNPSMDGVNSVVNSTMVFADKANDNFALVAGDTDAIGSGIGPASDAEVPISDIIGTSRTGTTTDIGAFMFVGGGGGVSITIDKGTQAQTVEQVTLTQHSVLSINGATQAQTVEQVTLQQAGTLSLNNLEQLQTVEQINLTQAHIISVDGAAQSQTVEQVSLLVAGTLAVNNTAQVQTLEQVVLSVIASLSIDSLSSAQTVEQVILSTISASAVIVNSTVQQQTVDQLNLTQAHAVSVDNLSQEQLLESINFNGVVVGYLQGALTIISAYNGQIKLTNPLTGEIRIL